MKDNMSNGKTEVKLEMLLWQSIVQIVISWVQLLVINLGRIDYLTVIIWKTLLITL